MTATVRDYRAFVAYLAGRSRRLFEWGKQANDCASFMAGAVEAQTGRDILADLPAWSSEAEATAILDARGGMAAILGGLLREIAPAQAHRGDVAGVPGPDGELILMIVEGQTLVGPAGPDRAGLGRLPRAAMIRAWSADLPLQPS